ncbi:MAG: hypothetical protein Kow0074_05520 [Candidatus Zixiibacteriota bacterium]
MKKDETPFYLTRVECPICKTVNEFETIKLGAYTESGRDTDFRPLNRQWLNPRYQNTNPLLFFMATCSSCFYTREFNRRFREWKSDATFRTHRQAVIRQRHLSALADDDSVIRQLGSALWPEAYPLKTALNKLLIGIKDELLLDHPSHFDIARWYLRTAWLFREMSDGGESRPSPYVVLRRQLLGRVRSLTSAIATVGESVSEIHELLDSHPESVATSPQTAEEERAISTDSVQGLADAVNTLRTLADQFAGQLHTLDSGTVVGEESANGERFGDHPSYTSFLKSLHSLWDGVPTDELEALQLSLENYRLAYEEGHRVPKGNAQIQLAYMVGELSRRCGRTREAQQYLNTAVRSGREWIHEHQRDPTKSAMARHVVDLAIEQLHRMREDSKHTA